MKLIFKKIQKDTIFCEDFADFQKNNSIEFSGRGISVLYGPNGVGKTSLCSVLSCDPNTNWDINLDDDHYTNDKNIFHIIADQNARNIIQGNTEDFLLGDNIRTERALKSEVDGIYRNLLENILNTSLKAQFNISKKTSKLIGLISNEKQKSFVKDLANNQSKGKNIKLDDFIESVSCLKKKETGEYNSEKYSYMIKDIEEASSVILKILTIDGEINSNTKINEIEENDRAIELLTRFINKKQCIVCDHAINPTELLERKKTNRKSVFELLDEKTKNILLTIVEQIKGSDPFCIKETIMSAIEQGSKDMITNLQEEIKIYMHIFDCNINNLFKLCLDDDKLASKNAQYKALLETKLEISDADTLFIEKIVSDNIGKPISLKRDQDNNIKLLMGDTEFINKDRNELHLSTGEQNFISLTFEFLKAKNSSSQVIVLDDPISSFDSIYKSKIAYAILKFLEGKNILILTHNTDLIRLLECQLKSCFTLYFFNNIQNENNGFIEVNKTEQEILLYLDKMIDLFRNNIFSEISDPKSFLISMIPFMRGYAQIIDDVDSKNSLTKLMHGYETEKVNVVKIYNDLFGKYKKLEFECEISVEDILDMDIDSLKPIKDETYSLLSKTLVHSISYLFLRLKVEKALVDLFSVNTKKRDQLGQIIDAALKDSSHLEERVYLTSRKTLLNEFNHFEGNMNIFQPAIDISDTTLKKEKEGILDLLNAMTEKYKTKV